MVNITFARELKVVTEQDLIDSSLLLYYGVKSNVSVHPLALHDFTAEFSVFCSDRNKKAICGTLPDTLKVTN